MQEYWPICGAYAVPAPTLLHALLQLQLPCPLPSLPAPRLSCPPAQLAQPLPLSQSSQAAHLAQQRVVALVGRQPLRALGLRIQAPAVRLKRLVPPVDRRVRIEGGRA